MYTTIDSVYFKNMLIGAYQLFQQKYEILNQLNVFPVPDGDTGNNMLNTLKSMYSMIADVDQVNQSALWRKKRLPALLWAQEEIPALSCPRLFMESAGDCMARQLRPAGR